MRKKWRPHELTGPRHCSFSAGLVAGLWARRARGGCHAATPTAVLGLEPLEGVPEALAADITDALRQRVAATKDYQLLQGKDLVEVKLVFACSDEAPACLSQAGKSLGASKLIFGNVKKTGSDFMVTLKLLDVSRAVVESFTTDTVPGGRANATALRQLAPIWLAKLSGKGNGTITVRANFLGAAVSLDGTRVGVTGTAPVVVSDVSPGKTRGLRREERLHDHQAGVHAGGRPEPAPHARSEPGLGRGPEAARDDRGARRPAGGRGAAGRARRRRQPPSSGPRRILGGGGRNGRLGGAGAEVRPERAGRQQPARPVPPLHLQHRRL